MISTHSILKSGVSLIAAAAVLISCSPSEPGAGEETSREARVAEAVAEMKTMLAAAEATNGPGHPAMWTLADEDTTINIFGTVHVLKPELEWRTDAFNTAFNSSDKLVLELDMHSPEGQQAVGTAMLGAAMFKDGNTLSDVLNDEDEAIVTEAAAKLGIPFASMQPVEPWFAALNLMNAQWVKDGFDPTSGVEMVLIDEAKEQGKSFGFLETAAVQAGVFDGLSMDAQIDLLVEGAMTLDLSGPGLDSLTAEWADGDIAGLGVIAANPDAAGDEEFYKALFLDRNSDWVPKIEALLDEPGTIMVAVGAGHLAGPDSVITMLEDKGHTLTRVQ